MLRFNSWHSSKHRVTQEYRWQEQPHRQQQATPDTLYLHRPQQGTPRPLHQQPTRIHNFLKGAALSNIGDSSK